MSMWGNDIKDNNKKFNLRNKLDNYYYSKSKKLKKPIIEFAMALNLLPIKLEK